ncbi:MAG: sugar phosphate isomerase/epimerase [Anaerolineae bacterium]|nr:sugar phosphate isomerase/epimerase [Anaerolineae bacterium]
MKLGIIGMIPSDFRTVDDALCQHIRAMGFSGVVAHLTGDPFSADLGALQHLQHILQRHGLRWVQLWGWYPSIVTDDEAVRASGIRAAGEIVRLGALMGVDAIGLRPTSMSHHGPWSPHPANYAPATEARLIDSLKQIVAVAAQHRLPIALECHVLTTLHSPAAIQRVLAAVNSPWLKINFDPVNLVGDLHAAYHLPRLLNELFDALGHLVIAAHIKDVTVEDDLVVHIREAMPGEGLMDFETLLTRFEALLPGAYAFIEHLPPEQVPQAAEFVRRRLNELHIPILE